MPQAAPENNSGSTSPVSVASQPTSPFSVASQPAFEKEMDLRELVDNKKKNSQKKTTYKSKFREVRRTKRAEAAEARKIATGISPATQRLLDDVSAVQQGIEEAVAEGQLVLASMDVDPLSLRRVTKRSKDESNDTDEKLENAIRKTKH
jgi:hypothetical protein